MAASKVEEELRKKLEQLEISNHEILSANMRLQEKLAEMETRGSSTVSSPASQREAPSGKRSFREKLAAKTKGLKRAQSREKGVTAQSARDRTDSRSSFDSVALGSERAASEAASLSDCLSAPSNAVEELESRFSDFQATITSAKEYIASLKDQKEKLATELIRLGKRHNELQGTVVDLRRSVEAENERRASSKTAEAQTDVETAAQSIIISSGKGEREPQSMEKEELIAEVDIARNESESLKAYVAKLELELAEAKLELANAAFEKDSLHMSRSGSSSLPVSPTSPVTIDELEDHDSEDEGVDDVEDESQRRDKYGFLIKDNVPKGQKDVDLRSEIKQGERWSAYLEKKDGDTADLSKSAKLRRLVIKGIPGEKRGDLWSTFLGKKERYAKGLYETLVKEMETTVTAATQQIDLDLLRTFPDNALFETDRYRQSLRRVLTAYSRKNEEVGYCQAMNFITGMFLLFMDEESAFYCLDGVVNGLLRGYFDPTLFGLLADQRVFDRILEKRLPLVHAKFKDLDVPSSLIITNWFMTLWANDFPTETTLRVWDQLFYDAFRKKGPQTLFRIALSLFKLSEGEVLKATHAGEVFVAMKEAASKMYDWKALIKLAQGDMKRLPGLKQMREVERAQVKAEQREKRRERQVHELGKETRLSKSELMVMQGDFRLQAGETDPNTTVDFVKFQDIFNRYAPTFPKDSMIMQRMFALAEDKTKSGFRVSSSTHASPPREGVNFDVFCVVLSDMVKGSMDQKLEMYFKIYDMDGDGTIQEEEVITIVKSVIQMEYEEARSEVESLFQNDGVGADREMTLKDLEKEHTNRATKLAKVVQSIFGDVPERDGSRVLTKEEFKEKATKEEDIFNILL